MAALPAVRARQIASIDHLALYGALGTVYYFARRRFSQMINEEDERQAQLEAQQHK